MALQSGKGEMTDDDYLTYPGFDVSFLVPPQHDADEIDKAIAEIKRDVATSAERHLPAGCVVQVEETV